MEKVIINDILSWVKKLSQKHEELDGFSICPYAKTALETNKVFFSYISDEAEEFIQRYIESLDKKFSVLIFFNVRQNLTDEMLLEIINNLNKILPDFVFLKDHPDNPGFIQGHNTGNGKYPTILVQPKKELLDARDSLKKTKYYDSWTEEYKKEIWSYGNESEID